MVISRPTLAEALRSPELKAALPRLLAFAARRLRHAGWPEGRDDVPSAGAAGDVVQEAVLRCLEGKWNWPEGVSLEHLLFGVIRNLVSHKRREAVSRPTAWIEDEDEPCAPSSRRDERLGAWWLCAAIERELQDDPEMSTLFAVLADGATKPAEAAAALGWTPERPSVVRRRMQRRLAAAGLWDGDDDERREGSRGARSAAPSRRVSR
jgi:DNA-directed RNA polymerase specialized sigma24 family protein